jgi:hypothetical protein
MGAYKNAKFIIGLLKSDFEIIMREKLELNGYKILEELPGKVPSYRTDAPEHIRMALHNDALDEFRMKYEGKFKDHPVVERFLQRAITRSYYPDREIDAIEADAVVDAGG